MSEIVDLKRIIIGKDYNEQKPILNILYAKTRDYEIPKYNYFMPTKYRIGHVENLQTVEDTFNKMNIYKQINKDILFSFWNTYKFYLQLAYPEVFKLTNYTMSMNNAPMISTIPKNKIVEFRNKNYLVNVNSSWIDFLILNFNRFPKVHNDKDLNKFAKLTHTIGNIIPVSQGFNTGRMGYDYGDFALDYMKDFLSPYGNSWKEYIEKNLLTPMINDDLTVKELFDDHFESPMPRNFEQIKSILTKQVNMIEKRNDLIVQFIHD